MNKKKHKIMKKTSFQRRSSAASGTTQGRQKSTFDSNKNNNMRYSLIK